VIYSFWDWILYLRHFLFIKPSFLRSLNLKIRQQEELGTFGCEWILVRCPPLFWRWDFGSMILHPLGFAVERLPQIQTVASSLWYPTLDLSFLFPASSLVGSTSGLDNASNLYLYSLEHISSEAPYHQPPQPKPQVLSLAIWNYFSHSHDYCSSPSISIPHSLSNQLWLL